MISRLMPAAKDVKALIGRVLEGDVMAAVELATLYRCVSVGDLVEVVCPTLDPSPAVFNTVADGWAVRSRVNQPKEVIR